jgi:Rad3-related DNA helicase
MELHEERGNELKRYMIQAVGGRSLRPDQNEKATEIATRVVDGRNLALQAPTGTGKSVFGIGVAKLMVEHFDARVVYLVHTKTLQEQVYATAVSVFGKERTATLYGRENYVCYSRLRNMGNKLNSGDKWLLMQSLDEEVCDPYQLFIDGYMKLHANEPKTMEEKQKQASKLFDSVKCKRNGCCSVESASGADLTACENCGCRRARGRMQASDIVVVNYSWYTACHVYGLLRMLLTSNGTKDVRIIADEADAIRPVVEAQLKNSRGTTFNGEFSDETYRQMRRIGKTIPHGCTETLQHLFAQLENGLAFPQCHRGIHRTQVYERVRENLGGYIERLSGSETQLREEVALFDNNGYWSLLDEHTRRVANTTLHGRGRKRARDDLRPDVQNLVDEVENMSGVERLKAEQSSDFWDYLQRRWDRRGTGKDTITKAMDELKQIITHRRENILPSTTAWGLYIQSNELSDEDTPGSVWADVHKAVATVLRTLDILRQAKAAFTSCEAWMDAPGVRSIGQSVDLIPDIERRELHIIPSFAAVQEETAAMIDDMTQVVFMSATMVTDGNGFSSFRTELGGRVEFHGMVIPPRWNYNNVSLYHGSAVGTKNSKNWPMYRVMQSDRKHDSATEWRRCMRYICSEAERLTQQPGQKTMFVIGPNNDRLLEVKNVFERTVSGVKSIWYANDKKLECIANAGNTPDMEPQETVVVFGSNSLAVGVDKRVDVVIVLQQMRGRWPRAQLDFIKLAKLGSDTLVSDLYQTETRRTTIQATGRLVRSDPQSFAARKRLYVMDASVMSYLRHLFPGIQTQRL